MAEPEKFVSGFVSILGRPNAGKSTLLNALVGTKLAIVADKPQTTRTLVQGVWNTPQSQVIFVDTPGIHKSDTMFNRKMMAEVRAALEERDLLLYLVDSTRRVTAEELHAIDMIARTGTPAFLILNKVDLVKDKRYLLPLIEEYRKQHEFAEYVPVSALTGVSVDALRKAIVARMPEGPAYYPTEFVTDQPGRFLASELIREKVLELTHHEVPHSVAVMIDVFEPGKKLTRVAATIYVERDGQKAIIIGSGGAMLKEIGTLARGEMERLIGGKFFLELFVKVRSNWRESPQFLNELDWRTMATGPP